MYSVNIASLRYYGSVFYASVSPDTAQQFTSVCRNTSGWQRIPHLIRWGTHLNKTVYFTMSTFHFLALTLHIPAELLIEEAKYFNRMGIAGYRIACEAYRQGYTLELLAENNLSDPDQPRGKAYRRAWHTILTGNLDSYTYGNYLQRIFKVCRTKLGIDIGDLLSKPVQNVTKDTTILTFSEMLSTLSPLDTAVLMGMAKLLHEYNLNNKSKQFDTNCKTLLRWYQDGRKKERSSTKGHIGSKP